MIRAFVKWFMEGVFMGVGAFIGVAIIGLSLVYFGFEPESDAMKVCQLSHSHDVCFQALNR